MRHSFETIAIPIPEGKSRLLPYLVLFLSLEVLGAEIFGVIRGIVLMISRLG